MVIRLPRMVVEMYPVTQAVRLLTGKRNLKVALCLIAKSLCSAGAFL
jgi:hypothetical protein